jgi:small conductance mechanosensitive channel
MLREKKKECFPSFYCPWQWLAIAFTACFLTVMTSAPTDAQSLPTTPIVPTVQPENLFFADVMVRGQPIFQIGGLSDLSATDRAEIINRRIASLLTQSQIQPIRVQPDRARSIVTLQVNNRVLMTVTQQDAQDFNAPIETLSQQWADQLNQALEQPPLVIDIGQRLYSTVRQLQRDTIDQLPALLGALLVMGLTGVLATIVRRVVMTGAGHWEVDHNSKVLVSRLGYSGVWVLGTVVALGLLGLDFVTLIGTLGLTSVAIGFSLRDVLSNYFSGIILLASRPFRLGDQIVIQDYEGTVTQIQLRATTLKTYDGRTVYIPNQQVFNASIVNNTFATLRRNTLTVGIDYTADIGTVKEIIRDAVVQAEGVEADPPPEILVWELGTSVVNLQVRIWVHSRRLSFLESTSRAAQAIKEALQAAQIETPCETYTVRLQPPLQDSEQPTPHYAASHSAPPSS